MATFVHRKNEPEGPRYRLWETQVDSYVTPPLTRDEMLSYLRTLHHERGSSTPEDRLDRADLRGTSSLLREARDPNGPWREELNPSPDGWGDSEV